MPRQYSVYILASKSRELYIGVTNDLARRMAEHRAGIHPDDHAYRHEAIRLVFVEQTGDVREAIRPYATIAPPTNAARANTPAMEDVIRCRCRNSSK